MPSRGSVDSGHVARAAFEEQVSDLDLLERLESGRDRTEAVVEELAELIDANVAERLVER